MESEESSIQKLSELNRIHSRMEPAGYLDKVYGLFFEKAAEWIPMPKLVTLDKLYSILEKDYKRTGFIGQGYHCLEHSLECALLTQEATLEPALNNPADRLELAAAALLHDYDPLRIDGAPDPLHTVKLITLDSSLTHTLADMELDPLKIALLIERTMHPMSFEDWKLWESRVADKLNNPEESARLIKKGTLLARLTRAASYVCLTPHEVVKRVEGLADELGLRRQYLLAETYNYLLDQGVEETAMSLPIQYKCRWELVEQYFMIISGFQPSLV